MNNIQKHKLLIILMLLSPGFWWPLLHMGEGFNELKKIPIYSQNKLDNLFSDERVNKVGAMRWANIDTSSGKIFYSKIFYNKAIILVDEFFSFLSFINPRYHFQSGDGTNFSPGKVEPIPILLFPFWFVGLLMSIKKKKNRLLLYYLFIIFLIFLFGKLELPFTFPIIVFNIYISYFALKNIRFKRKPLLIAGIIAYSFYINFRLIFI
jgi:hypothetical protein